MDEVARTRRATREAVGNITPARLREVIDDRVDEVSMIPGVLTLLSARVMAAPDGGAVARPPTDAADRSAVERRAAGVQLIYEGLGLTRSLVRGDPWGGVAPPNSAADLDILAADMLVARGFRLLARTEAAGKAVETVRAFGRYETDTRVGRETGAEGLEANVFDLAAIAGATVATGEVPLPLRQYVVGLAHSRGHGDDADPLPPAAEGLPETIEEVMRRVSAPVDGARPQSAGSANRND